MSSINKFIKNIGIARIIIALFLISLFVVGSFFQINPITSFSDVVNRVGMNGILVLSMIPMIQGGCGLNFGIPLGLVAGIFGAVFSLEMQLTGALGLFAAIAIAVAFSSILGYLYSVLLNRVKGDEMIIATYVGYSFVYVMNIFWMTFPFKNPTSVQGFKGEGLRATISIDKYWAYELSNFLKFQIGDFIFPTGMILLLAFMCLLVWLFFRTKTGTAITAVGSNPEYARAAGININKMRTISIVLSTAIASIGLVVYQQGFGFVQTLTAPLAFTFPSVAAVLLGGASVNKASIANVIIGTILFQGIITMTPTVINSIIEIDASEVFRIMVTNGMILYALTRKTRQDS